MKKKAEAQVKEANPIADSLNKDISELKEKVSLLHGQNISLIKLLKKIHLAWGAEYDALLEKL